MASDRAQNSPAPRRRGRPVQVWVTTDDAGQPVVSFEHMPDATMAYVPMPSRLDVLLELHGQVATTMRVLADADNNRDAARILRMQVQAGRTSAREARGGSSPTVQAVPTESPAWRQAPVTDVRREYPAETGESVRALPAGQPDSNRRRH
jgi:hypothetical protein